MSRAFAIAAAIAGLAGGAPDTSKVQGESAEIDTADLGKVHVYQPAGTPWGSVVFLSGDGGWKAADAGAAAAQAFADQGILALGVDVNRTKALLARGQGPLDLGQILHGLAVTQDTRWKVSGPIFLGGYSAGATLAYAGYSQDPAGLFSGLMTLSFCPSKATRRPVGGPDSRSDAHRLLGLFDWVYKPVPVAHRWALVEGSHGRGCVGGSVTRFASAVPGAHVWVADGLRHSLSPQDAWTGPRRDAIRWMIAGA